MLSWFMWHWPLFVQLDLTVSSFNMQTGHNPNHRLTHCWNKLFPVCLLSNTATCIMKAGAKRHTWYILKRRQSFLVKTKNPQIHFFGFRYQNRYLRLRIGRNKKTELNRVKMFLILNTDRNVLNYKFIWWLCATTAAHCCSSSTNVHKLTFVS